jgi:hypothetical protein
MNKYIYYTYILSLFIFSCNQPKKNINKKQIFTKQLVEKPILLDKNKKLVKRFLEMFSADSVSIKSFENLFGSYLVEEEGLFFEECEAKNTIDYCNKIFDNCLLDTSKCQSLVFKKIKENRIIEQASLILEKEFILEKLEKIDNHKYESKYKNNDYLFIFTGNEQGKWILEDFLINDKSIFKNLFN